MKDLTKEQCANLADMEGEKGSSIGVKGNRILAFLPKPKGRGSMRAWYAYRFDTEVQSFVEQFMTLSHYGCSEYFLAFDSDLVKMPPYQVAYDGRLSGKFPVVITEVKVIQRYYKNRKEYKLLFQMGC